MQQIVLRYAEEHGIDLDGLLYVGHTDEIESAKGLKGSFQPYFLRWRGDTRDNGKFFERVLKS
jgi:histidinol phosphatase-like enzyme